MGPFHASHAVVESYGVADDFSSDPKYPFLVRTRILPRPDVTTFTSIFLYERAMFVLSGEKPSVYCPRRSRAICFEMSVTLSRESGK